MVTLKLRPSRLESSKVEEMGTLLGEDDAWGKMLAYGRGFELLRIVEYGQVGRKLLIAIDLEQDIKRLKLLGCDERVFGIRRFVREKLQEGLKIFLNEILNQHLFIADIKGSVRSIARRTQLIAGSCT